MAKDNFQKNRIDKIIDEKIIERKDGFVGLEVVTKGKIFTVNDTMAYSIIYATKHQRPLDGIAMFNEDKHELYQMLLRDPNREHLAVPEHLKRPVIGVRVGVNGNVLPQNKVLRFDRNSMYKSWQDAFQRKTDKKSHVIAATVYSVEGDTITARKTGKEYKKVTGLMVDSVGLAFRLSKFNVNAVELERFTSLKKGNHVLIYGHPRNSKYEGDYFEPELMYYDDLEEVNPDNSNENGRYELSVHTMFSQSESVVPSGAVYTEAAKKGLAGLVLTDSVSVQGYADAMKVDGKGKFNHMQPLYGAQLNEIKKRPQFVINPNDDKFIDENGLIAEDKSFVAFDIETTGFSPIYDDIIQLSAVRFERVTKIKKKGKKEEKTFEYELVDKLDTFVNTNKQLPQKIMDLTHITQKDVDEAPVTQSEAVKKFVDFCNEVPNTLLIGQNVIFDYQFINRKLEEAGEKPLKFEIFDTLPMARRILPNSRAYNLTALSKKLKVKLDKAHNSLYDCEATGRVFFQLINLAVRGSLKNKFTTTKKEKEAVLYPDWQTGMDLHNSELDDHAYQEGFAEHLDIIAKNQVGIKDLYELISIAHTKHFYREPRLYLDEIKEKHDKGNLLLGSGDGRSALFDAVFNHGYDKGLKIIKEHNFDYLEILPPSAIGLEKGQREQYQGYLNNMLNLAEDTDTIPVVIGDVHYLTPTDRLQYDVLHKIDYRNDKQNLSLRSARDLFNELSSFADHPTLQAIIVDNTQKIANMVDNGNIEPIHLKLTPPKMPGADDELTETAWNTAHKLYGKELPQLISDRIKKELKSIIENGYSVIYLTAKKLVDISNSKGYLVGSRGSVGSSLVAFLIGITEVNALPPHYRSKHGDYVEFVDPKRWASGFDLPPKQDPNHPGEYLIGDGHNCTFEIFAGASGRKVPDIDLNFASDIQHEAQLWLRNKIFDPEHTYRVGTVGAIAEKTGFAKVKDYERKLDVKFTDAEISMLADELVGVKQTSGQHAAGVLIVPQDKEITDFSPYTYPANKMDANWLTTQFTKGMIHDSLLKMDCLGHDDEAILHQLQEMTGIDPKSISQQGIQEVVQKLFKSKAGTAGLPEFGTEFASQMVMDMKPTCFSDLVQLSGLSHGTDVYQGNAKDLVLSGKATLREVIGCRDKIINDVMNRGWDIIKANELVQIIKTKGRSIPDDMRKELAEMEDLPNWYVESMEKIKYLFPMAHATAYVLSATRLGWFKLHYPREFYAGWFSYRSDRFDMPTVLTNDPKKYGELYHQRKNSGKKLTPVEVKKQQSLLMAAYAVQTGKVTDKDGNVYDGATHFAQVDLNKSEAVRWTVDKETGYTYPGISTLDDVSDTMGEGIVAYREEKGHAPTHSKELIDYGVKLQKKSIKSLVEAGLLVD